VRPFIAQLVYARLWGSEGKPRVRISAPCGRLDLVTISTPWEHSSIQISYVVMDMYGL
jgi:hypothetical protein